MPSPQPRHTNTPSTYAHVHIFLSLCECSVHGFVSRSSVQTRQPVSHFCSLSCTQHGRSWRRFLEKHTATLRNFLSQESGVPSPKSPKQGLGDGFQTVAQRVSEKAERASHVFQGGGGGCWRGLLERVPSFLTQCLVTICQTLLVLSSSLGFPGLAFLLYFFFCLSFHQQRKRGG